MRMPLNAPAASPARSAEGAGQRPASLREVELDLREDMRAGREPFSRIMAAVGALQDGEVLLLRTIFEPVPLFGVLAKRGFLHEATPHTDDDWSVWFWHEPVVADPPTVWLDVRGLEPPEPLHQTLAALDVLPDGHQLVQVNVRVPQLLLPMLAERGYACEIDDSVADQVNVRIWRVRPR